jgi:molecular chaperone DnaK
VEKTLVPCKQALTDAGLTADKLDEVILVGSQTRMPLVQQKVKAFFNKEPNRSVNPEEVVSIGAAIQGGVLKGEVKDVLLLDVTPLTLGIETLGGVGTPLIPRNTTIPTSKSQVFSTAADNQPSVEIHVLQGERPMAIDNRTLGRFMLDGILPSPRGLPQIEVTFDIDANGILNVKATDKGTGREQKITITASSGLKKEDIDKMQQEAASHAADDARKKEEAEVRNTADTLAYTAEKMLRENKEKIPADLNSEVEGKIAALRSALQANNTQSMKTATDDLNTALQKIGQAVYQQSRQQPPPPGGEAGGQPGDQPGGQQPPPPGGQGGQGGPGGQGTVEGEFREV